MKYIKTYEQYSVNEEFLGLGKLWDKVRNAFSSWKDEKMKQVAKTIADKIEEKKADPEFESVINKVKEEYNKLTPDQKQELVNKIEDKVENIEEVSMEETNESKMRAGQILQVLGLGMGFMGLITALISMFIPVIATTIIGVALWKIVAISLTVMFGGMILNPIGQTMIEKERGKGKI
jgi:hypothetical protein